MVSWRPLIPAVLVAFASCTSLPKAAPPPPTAPAPSAKAVVLLAAGDVAWCKDLTGARTTAEILASEPGTIAILGDLAYRDAPGAFAACYDGSNWGRFKERSHPAAGNHEYHVPHAADYFAYWGPAAGDPAKGYYSFELGSWHLVAVNSNCDQVGGCGAGSAQEEWLRQDLAAHPGGCILAFWHHPLFSSGVKKSSALHPEMRAIWQDLYDAHSAIVLNGHEHNYERFAPQSPSGEAEPSRGIREFVVGTGGANFSPLGPPTANSEAQRFDTFGVLKLTLREKGYAWEFLSPPGGTFKDQGSGNCP
jgi:hypothetical protein